MKFEESDPYTGSITAFIVSIITCLMFQLPATFIAYDQGKKEGAQTVIDDYNSRGFRNHFEAVVIPAYDTNNKPIQIQIWTKPNQNGEYRFRLIKDGNVIKRPYKFTTKE